jgi:alginate O-acetyltransferase complex protein AlgI
MGGNRHGKAREIAALLTTFGLTSLWHGATWPYLIWGGMWSGLLVVERFTGLRKATRFNVIRRAWMILFIVFSWVPFRSTDTDAMMNMWSAMLSATGESMNPDVTAALTPISVAAIALGLVGFLIPQRMGSRLHDYVVLRADGAPRLQIALPLGFACLLIGVMLSLWSSFSPFLYYQF